MLNTILLLILGAFVGVISGVVGIGGGVLFVPILVLFFGYSQYQAQGTTLALMVPPIGFLAAYAYYKSGYVDLKVATFLALGFFLGGYFGAKLALNIPVTIIRKIFAIFLMYSAIRIFLKK